MKVWDSEERETVNRYDKNHNLISVREQITDKEWRETLYRYDLMGRRTASRDGLGNETEFQYETI